MKDDIKDPLSGIIKRIGLKLINPLSDNIKKYIEDNYNSCKCPLGRPELDKFCSLAYKDSDKSLLCGAMLNWTKHIQVKGLKKCFLLMQYENKLGEANRRNRGNFNGSNYKKVNRN